MQMSTKTEYALRALIEIRRNGDTPISSREICQRQKLPHKYVEHLLSALKQAKLVKSVAGSQGGYLLAKKSNQINLHQIMQAVEDHDWQPICVSKSPEHCVGEKCFLQDIWKDVSQKIKNVLSDYTLDKIDMAFTNNKR